VHSITIDGMEEMEFRRSIETMLRRGQADDAAKRLRELLEGYAGEGRQLPARFLAVTADDVRLEGWNELGGKLGEYDRPEAAMSAISIDILDPQGVGVRPDEQGRLKPVIETSYFSDSAYPFSEAGREDLLDGYSSFGCEWQGNFENVDTTISVDGIDDLYGATVALENRVASGNSATTEDIEAGSVGSCYIAVLIHQAIRNAALDKGLPRPICVIAGSNDAYPFFDAPAMTVEEYCMANGITPAIEAEAASEFEEDFGEDAPQVAHGLASLESLMSMGGKKKEKKPVLTIDPDEADTAESLELQEAADFDAIERERLVPAASYESGEEHEIAGHGWQEAPAIPHGEAAQPPVPGEFRPEDAEEFGMEAVAAWQDDMQWAPAPPAEDDDEPAAPAPIDFGAYRDPPPAGLTDHEELPSIDFGAVKPEAPGLPQVRHEPETVDVAPDELQTPAPPPMPAETAPAGFAEGEPAAPQAPEAPAPLDFDASEHPYLPRIEDEEPPAPPDRLYSEEPAPPPAAGPQDGVGHTGAAGAGTGSPEPVVPQTMDLPAGRLADEEPVTDAPGYDDHMAALRPVTLSDDRQPGDARLEQPETPEAAAASDATGDNASWPSAPARQGEAQAAFEPRPARHAIRMRAASVTNKAQSRPSEASPASESLVVRLILGIARAIGWLRRRFAKR
jgi:hypothetical protein